MNNGCQNNNSGGGVIFYDIDVIGSARVIVSGLQKQHVITVGTGRFLDSINYRRIERVVEFRKFPKFLLEMNLSQNARVIYMLLYDRGRLSRKNRWTDEDGYVYSVFPIAELSLRFGKCQSSVKAALKELDDAGLLIRRAWGVSKYILCHLAQGQAKLDVAL